MIKRFVALVAAAALAAPPAASAAAPPNDPGYQQQWGLQALNVAAAWSASRGAGIVVAVIDTGVDAKHPDLDGQVLPGRDLVDDDTDASDAKGHGTHVAGTIAAVSGNGSGVASVAPAAKILPVRVLGSDGEGDPGDVAEGIRWAVSRGAKVVNLSLAQDEVDGLAVGGEALLRDSRVDRAIADAARRGALVVVAAGNDDSGGRSRTSYDSRTAGVVVVGAATRKNQRAAYSNYGGGLDLMAPGGGSASDAKACGSADWIVSTWWNPSARRSDYGGGCGTSMAVAHVSGLGALLMSRGYSNAGAAQRMRATALDVGARGRDQQTGYGVIDAARALGVTRPKPNVPVTSQTQGGISNAPTPGAAPTQRHPDRPEPDTPVAVGPLDGAPERPARTVPLAAAALALAVVVGGHVAQFRKLFSAR